MYDPPKLRTTSSLGHVHRDLGDGDVLVAEELVNGLGCAVEEVVEIQVARDETRHTGDHREAIRTAALVGVAPRVVHGDRGVARELLDGADVAGSEQGAT